MPCASTTPMLPLCATGSGSVSGVDDLLCTSRPRGATEAVRAVLRICVRLRRDRADDGLPPRDDGADGEKLRLGGGAPLRRRRGRTRRSSTSRRPAQSDSFWGLNASTGHFRRIGGGASDPWIGSARPHSPYVSSTRSTSSSSLRSRMSTVATSGCARASFISSGVPRADDDRAGLPRSAAWSSSACSAPGVEEERAIDVELALQRDLGNAAARSCRTSVPSQLDRIARVDSSTTFGVGRELPELVRCPREQPERAPRTTRRVSSRVPSATVTASRGPIVNCRRSAAPRRPALDIWRDQLPCHRRRTYRRRSRRWCRP